MKIQSVKYFLFLVSLLITNSSYAAETELKTKCQEYEELAVANERTIPDDFEEICETPEAINQLEVAQEVDTAKQEKEQLADQILAEPLSVETIFSNKNDDSVLDRAVASSGSAIEFNASTENNSILWRVGREISSGSNNVAQFTAWSLTASSPIDSDDDAANIATLDGLADSTQLTFSLSKFFLTGTQNPFAPGNKEEAQKYDMICQLIDQKDGCALEDVEDRLKEKVSKGELDLSKEEQEKIVDTFKSLFFEPDSFNYGFSFEGAVGYENFEFINVETGEQADQSEIPWSVGAFFSVNPPTKHPLLFTLGLEYQEAFVPSTSQIICPTSNIEDTVTCSTGVFGVPNQTENLLLSLETRSNLGGLAFSLRGTHDFNNDNTGIDLPIFLVSDQEGNLNGGIRLGWTNVDDDSDLNLGVFIGSNFNLF